MFTDKHDQLCSTCGEGGFLFLHGTEHQLAFCRTCLERVFPRMIARSAAADPRGHFILDELYAALDKVRSVFWQEAAHCLNEAAVNGSSNEPPAVVLFPTPSPSDN